MKNVHLLPTDKSSRLYKTGGFLLLDSRAMPNNTLETKNQHIYITSDEEIKDGYYLDLTHNIVMKAVFYPSSDKNCKKIILTTDQDLIKDGVQAIDDEFLEWFVKNPSCEEVETYSLGLKNQLTGESGHYKYEIIILKEESKQETLEEAVERLSKNAYKKHSVKDDKLSLDEQIQRSGGFIVGFKEGMIEGAKWQAERMYSEEEMIDFAFNTYYYISKIMNVPFNQISENKLHAIDNLEQFKKRNGK